MASTNKTSNYNLSQFLGTDKPTWLGDYNSDMQKIDAQMKVNADNVATAISSASTATSTANTANATANQANTTANTANTTANQANTTAGNAQSTANSALATATTAQTSANTAIANTEEFNLDTITSIAKSDTTSSNVNNDYYLTNLKLATNSANKSVFKLYGQVVAKLTNTQVDGYIAFQSALRPTADITINGAGICSFESNGAIGALRLCDIEVKTTGEVRIIVPIFGDNICRLMLLANLYLVKDFGDTPTPTE